MKLRKLIYFHFVFMLTFNLTFAVNPTNSVNICFNLKTPPTYGKRSPDILAIQKFLNETIGLKVKTSGFYDLQTKKAIGKFQLAYGTKPTGIVNIRTLYILQSMNNCDSFVANLAKIIEDKNYGVYKDRNKATTTTQVSTSSVISVVAVEQKDFSDNQTRQLTQNQIIENLLAQQTVNSGIYVIDPSRNTSANGDKNDSLFGLNYFVATTSDIKYTYIQTEISTNGKVRRMLDLLHQNFIFGGNITVIFERCPKEGANAFFDWKTNSITLCYELIHKFVQENTQSTFTTQQKIQQAIDFTLLHEFGHAMVFYYDLPITGKEESAVDEFAMYILMKLGDQESIDSAIEGVRQFGYETLNDSKLTNDEYAKNHADVHDLNLVRYFDLVKFMVGIFPEMKTTGWVGNEFWQIPTYLAVDLEYYAARKIKTWDRLLEGKLR